MLRKPQYIALGIVALVGLIFLSLPESVTNRVKLTLVLGLCMKVDIAEV